MAKQPQKSLSKDALIKSTADKLQNTGVGEWVEIPKGVKIKEVVNELPVSIPVPPKVEKAPLKYDWLSIPRGMFDLTTAGVEFRDEEGGLRNKALALQYRGLLASGYRLHSFVPNGGEVFLVFEKA